MLPWQYFDCISVKSWGFFWASEENENCFEQIDKFEKFRAKLQRLTDGMGNDFWFELLGGFKKRIRESKISLYSSAIQFYLQYP